MLEIVKMALTHGKSSADVDGVIFNLTRIQPSRGKTFVTWTVNHVPTKTDTASLTFEFMTRDKPPVLSPHHHLDEAAAAEALAVGSMGDTDVTMHGSTFTIKVNALGRCLWYLDGVNVARSRLAEAAEQSQNPTTIPEWSHPGLKKVPHNFVLFGKRFSWDSNVVRYKSLNLKYSIMGELAPGNLHLLDEFDNLGRIHFITGRIRFRRDSPTVFEALTFKVNASTALALAIAEPLLGFYYVSPKEMVDAFRKSPVAHLLDKRLTAQRR